MACRSCAHVVLVPTPFGGHCFPFFHLASRLAHLGLKVTFLVPEHYVPRFYSDSQYIGVIHGKDIQVVAVKVGFIQRGVQGFIETLKESSEAQLVAAFAEYMSPVMSSKEFSSPCCIVSDMLMGWTQSLAAQFGIPRFVLHTQSAGNLSLMLHVPALLAEGRLPLTADNQSDPVEIPGFKVPLPTAELPSDLHPGSILADSYENFLRISRRAAAAPIVLVNTFRELEGHVFTALDELHRNAAGQMPRAIAVGPLLPSSAFTNPDTTAMAEPVMTEEVDESVVLFLDKQPRRSVLYIAFGTVGVFSFDKHIEEIALGLEASEQPFLWIGGPTPFRPDAPTLTQLVPSGFEERTKERGMLVGAWAPQLRILQHPATGAFLSHCGWNSVLESVAAGLPILAWPVRAEQKMNARFIVDVAKVAAEFKWGEGGKVTRGEVERVVRLVMQQDEGAQLRSNVEALKESAAKNVSSVDGLKTFIALCEDICNHKCCT